MAQDVEDEDGLFFRLVNDDDRDLFIEAFKTLSEETRQYRFLHQQKELSAEQLYYLTHIDYHTHVAWLAFLPPDAGVDSVRDRAGNILVGVGRYIQVDQDSAEIAFVTTEQYRNKGVAQRILKKLSETAEENRISIFTGQMLISNTSMKRIFEKNAAVFTQIDPETIQFSFKICSKLQ